MGLAYKGLTHCDTCLKKTKYPETTYTLLHCTKYGWTSGSWNECGYEDYKEYQELEEIYLKEQENV